jgi:hypothetical protein
MDGILPSTVIGLVFIVAGVVLQQGRGMKHSMPAKIP